MYCTGTCMDAICQRLYSAMLDPQDKISLEHLVTTLLACYILTVAASLRLICAFSCKVWPSSHWILVHLWRVYAFVKALESLQETARLFSIGPDSWIVLQHHSFHFFTDTQSAARARCQQSSQQMLSYRNCLQHVAGKVDRLISYWKRRGA